MTAIVRLWSGLVTWVRGHIALLTAAAAAVLAVYAEARAHRGVSKTEDQDEARKATKTEVDLHTVAVEQGAAAAHQKVQQEYRETISKLNDQQHQQATALLQDPEALAKFLAEPQPVDAAEAERRGPTS